MMALIRFIYDFVKKEELVASRYIREHPRRNWLIAMDAVITISLVLGGVAYASQSSKNATSNELMRIGAMPMSASRFMEYAHHQGGREYWLGTREGFGISSDARDEHERFISYVKDGSDPRDPNGREITIITHHGIFRDENLHRLAAGSMLSTFVTSSGRIVHYDAKAMADEVVLLDGNSNPVSIHYLKAQSMQTLLDNAVALRIAG